MQLETSPPLEKKAIRVIGFFKKYSASGTDGLTQSTFEYNGEVLQNFWNRSGKHSKYMGPDMTE